MSRRLFHRSLLYNLLLHTFNHIVAGFFFNPLFSLFVVVLKIMDTQQSVADTSGVTHLLPVFTKLIVRSHTWVWFSERITYFIAHREVGSQTATLLKSCWVDGGYSGLNSLPLTQIHSGSWCNLDPNFYSLYFIHLE